VTMDMTVVEGNEFTNVGDFATIYGTSLPNVNRSGKEIPRTLDEIASDAKTMSYEMLTGLQDRLTKNYHS